jgi:hypothetical protein
MQSILGLSCNFKKEQLANELYGGTFVLKYLILNTEGIRKGRRGKCKLQSEELLTRFTSISVEYLLAYYFLFECLTDLFL